MIDHVEARERLSLELDGELDAALASELQVHLARCADCAHHRDALVALRRDLRDEDVTAPDVRAGVLAAIAASTRGAHPEAGPTTVAEPGPALTSLSVFGHHVEDPVRPDGERVAVVVERGGWTRGRRWLPVAACLAIGLIIGSVLVGGFRSPSNPAAAQVPERIAAAQFAVTSMSARLEVTERGWHASVPTRSYAGTIDYQAPDDLALHLEDTTSYPSAAWVPNDVDLVRTGDQWWAQGPRDCASAAQPGCTSPEPRLQVIDNLGPFADGAPVPLDLVVPVRSFLRSPEPPALGSRTIDGREAVGVEVSAAQVAPLLDGLRPAGNLRQFFPTDVVALWLDAASWSPLRIEVRASADPDRRTWAVDHGYVDQPGDEVLTVVVRDLAINEGIEVTPVEWGPEVQPMNGVRRDAGFVPIVDGATASGSVPPGLIGVELDPAALPAGLAPWTTGTFGLGTAHETVVQTWFGGSGWLKVASTTGWDGTSLFGDLGSPVRRTTAPDGSVRYSNLDGTRHAIHAGGVDVVVTGSLDDETLATVVAGLDVRGIPVPEDWSDAATETIESATDLLPGLLVPGADAAFDEAAVRADGNVVTQAYAGAGSRGFVVVEAPGERLAPPLDMAVAGVVVRGVDGRFSASRGELEWVEGDRIHRLTSSTLSRAELLRVAEAMIPA